MPKLDQDEEDFTGQLKPTRAAPNLPAVIRIKSQDLFRQTRVVEIDHDGRIYRLRVTQLNKLILTA